MTDDLPSLSSQGQLQLYPDDTASEPVNHVALLHKLAKSLLLNILEYVSILCTAPAHHEDKLADIRNLFINAHHLINIYRPHQTRETLISRMERQAEEGKKEIEEMRAVIGKVDAMLEDLEKDGIEMKGLAKRELTNTHGDKMDSEDNKARMMWDLLDQDSDDG